MKNYLEHIRFFQGMNEEGVPILKIMFPEEQFGIADKFLINKIIEKSVGNVNKKCIKIDNISINEVVGADIWKESQEYRFKPKNMEEYF